MPVIKKYWDLDTKDSIVRGPSSRALERQEWLSEKKSKGCELCGSKGRLAFKHRDPTTKEFDIQSAGIVIDTSRLEAEMAKCVLICTSCNLKIKGPYRPSSKVRNKELFWELQKTYYVPVVDISKKKKGTKAKGDAPAGLLTSNKGSARSAFPRKNSGPITQTLRDLVMDRDAGLCGYCSEPATEIDHLTPWSHGGTDDPENLMACCGVCNKIASSSVFDTLEEKRYFVRKRRGLL